MTQNNKYEKYTEKVKNMSVLGGVMGLLHWDEQLFLPAGSRKARQKQMSAMAKILHELATSKEYGKLIYDLYEMGQEKFDPYAWKNITESKKAYDESTKVPQELLEESVVLGMQGYNAWEQARKKNEYSSYASIIKKWVELRKKIASHIYPDKHPYDVCLDGYEDGLSREIIDAIFERLKPGLVELCKKIMSSKTRIPTLPLINLEVDKQKELNRRIIMDLGFDFNYGCFAVSAHPFSGRVHNTDVRMTTRYRENDYFSSMMSAIHETGHAIYDQARAGSEYDGLPVNESLGMLMHESQSLLWERLVAQSKCFWYYLCPLLEEYFPGKFKGYSAEDFYRSTNKFQPTLIRLDADEVTYHFHIIIRYEIEKLLFDDRVKVEELPELWNNMYEELLGIRPPTDSEGILQDVHWADGGFGYFPSYSLGAMYGAQFFHTAKKEIPEMEEEFKSGNYKPLKDWLNEKVHKMGRLYRAGELIKRVTGRYLDTDSYLAYLTEKYGGIYAL
ncbi:carboxypeptidase M32 [Candidatus Riflebacteria bacterium]